MEKLVKREIFKDVLKHLKEKEITVLVGPRQTGKTTLLFQLKDYLIKKEKISESKIKFFNLDLISDIENIRDQKEFVKYLKEEIKKEKNLIVIIDEVQRLENAGKFLKGIYDLNLPLKFIVSGSSSLELKSKIFEALTGRKRIFHLWPFSFKEFLLAKKEELQRFLDKKSLSLINRERILDLLYEFIIFGGYPRVVLAGTNEEKIKILEEIYSSYIEKDIISFLKVKQPFLFSKLVTILANQAGSLLNLNELSNTLRINYRTLESYLDILENTFIIKLLRPYFTNPRKELTKMPKVYFIDTGLLNFAIKNFSKFENHFMKGVLLENFVFSSLIKAFSGQINFWRTRAKSEVDFVLRDYFGNLIPIEIKATELKKEIIPSGLKSFINQYKVKKAYLVNLGLEKKIKKEGTEINFILPITSLP